MTNNSPQELFITIDDLVLRLKRQHFKLGSLFATVGCSRYDHEAYEATCEEAAHIERQLRRALKTTLSLDTVPRREPGRLAKLLAELQEEKKGDGNVLA